MRNETEPKLVYSIQYGKDPPIFLDTLSIEEREAVFMALNDAALRSLAYEPLQREKEKRCKKGRANGTRGFVYTTEKSKPCTKRTDDSKSTSRSEASGGL
ncbi:MAG: hypothetical protein PWP24_287 [Clostridiales bacterium]|nr:hypothetical protein [Clostridiales bacterium]